MVPDAPRGPIGAWTVLATPGRVAFMEISATVAGLFIGEVEGGPIQSRDEVQAVAGSGLMGDRYFGSSKAGHDPTEEITLFEKEAVDRVNRELDLGLGYEDMRRNVMTEGVDLRSLIGRSIKVGEAEIEVMEDNPPCRHLEALAGKPLLKPLIDRGGVRGRITRSGTIRTGDPVVT